MVRGWIWGVVALLVAAQATAGESFDRTRLYGGGGLGATEVKGVSDGYAAQQIYGGYQWLYPKDGWGFAGEAGYLNTSQVAWDGPWLAAVASYHFAPGLEFVGRLGVDLGDDLGGLGGVGISYAIERNMEVRLEYQQRTHMQSVLLNVVWRPWFFRAYSDSY